MLSLTAVAKPLVSLAGLVLQALDLRPLVKCTVHKAFFSKAPDVEHAFIKITNASSKKDVEVSHVWFETQPPAHVMTRPLRVRLKPDETWETWIEVAHIPQQEQTDIFSKARVRLSSGKVFHSKEGKNIPPVGYVAGR